MRTIWKFAVPVQERFTLDLPPGAEVLHLATQRGHPHPWVMLDPEETARTEWRFVTVGTGHHVPDSNWLHYIGSYQLRDGEFVFHLFQEVAA